MPFNHNFVFKPREINLYACEFLQTLKLGGTSITDRWFEHHVPKFTILEMFSLDVYDHLRNINIFLRQLQSFELLQCCNFVVMDLDTLNLLSFTYCGWTSPSIQLPSTSLAILWDAQICSMLCFHGIQLLQLLRVHCIRGSSCTVQVLWSSTLVCTISKVSLLQMFDNFQFPLHFCRICTLMKHLLLFDFLSLCCFLMVWKGAGFLHYMISSIWRWKQVSG